MRLVPPSEKEEPTVELPRHLVVQRVLGQGGTSIVYEAIHTRLKVSVAVKVLAHTGMQEGEARERLVREAELYARLSDPRIPRVYDVDLLADGTPYVVMERIIGRTLAEQVTRGPLPIEAACAIAREVLAALVDIHRVGIIHRDIKPANILLEERHNPEPCLRVRVVDFGVAKSMADASQALTQRGAMVGTPHYMAPEQITGDPLDGRVDLYAVGVMLYEMLSGRVPFDGHTVGEVFAAALRDKPAPLDSLREDVPPELQAFVERAIARDRQQRFGSAEEMLASLQAVSLAPPPSPALQRESWLNRGCNTVCAALALSLMVAALQPTPVRDRGESVSATVAIDAWLGPQPLAGVLDASGARDGERTGRATPFQLAAARPEEEKCAGFTSD